MRKHQDFGLNFSQDAIDELIEIARRAGNETLEMHWAADSAAHHNAIWQHLPVTRAGEFEILHLEHSTVLQMHDYVLLVPGRDEPVRVSPEELSDPALLATASQLTGQSFGHRQSGVALTEFAIALPVLLLLFLGGVEVSRYILINQKLDKATNTMADIATQMNFSNQTPDQINAQLAQLSDAIVRFMNPYPFATSDALIFTAISRDDQEEISKGRTPSDKGRISFQFSKDPAAVSRSRIGAEGQVPNLPPGFTLADGDDIIIAETFYQFRSLIGEAGLNNLFGRNGGFLPDVVLYKTAIFRPRLGTAPAPFPDSVNPHETVAFDTTPPCPVGTILDQNGECVAPPPLCPDGLIPVPNTNPLQCREPPPECPPGTFPSGTRTIRIGGQTFTEVICSEIAPFDIPPSEPFDLCTERPDSQFCQEPPPMEPPPEEPAPPDGGTELPQT